MGVCPARSKASASAQADNAALLRERRLAKLSAPGDLSDAWTDCFLSASLEDMLRRWRDQPFPNGALLMLVLEGPASDVFTQRLQKFVWPTVAPGLFSRCPEIAGEILAGRLKPPGTGAPHDDTAMLLKVLGQSKTSMKLPAVFFLWGSPQICAGSLVDRADADSVRNIVRDVQAKMRQDWVERGFDEDAENAKRQDGKVMELKDLEPRRAVESLHRKQAEHLLAACSASRADALIRKGFARPQDFVFEDIGVSLDADRAAQETRDANLLEGAEREALRAEQAAELAASEAADAQRLAEAEMAQKKKDREEEELEAREIWAAADKEHRLGKLPEEPAEDSSNVITLTLLLPNSGRRLARRWKNTDELSAVAEFAFASASEEELPYANGRPKLLRSFPRVELSFGCNETLADVALSNRESLHVAPASM